MMLFKKQFDKLVTKVNDIAKKTLITSGLISKTQYNSDKQNLEKKMNKLIKRYPITVDWLQRRITLTQHKN